MTRRIFFIYLMIFIIEAISNAHLLAGKKVHYVPPDTRTLVTAVDQHTKTVTVTAMMTKATQTYQFADSTFYKSEVIIDGQEKSISDIVVGLQFFTCSEIQSGIIQSITLGKAAPAPK